jgi:hypothetical protein
MDKRACFPLRKFVLGAFSEVLEHFVVRWFYAYGVKTAASSGTFLAMELKRCALTCSTSFWGYGRRGDMVARAVASAGMRLCQLATMIADSDEILNMPYRAPLRRRASSTMGSCASLAFSPR